MEKKDTTYTSFELMKIFGIKKGSWDYLKRKLNLDDYAEKIKTDKKDKYIYTNEAYKILQENYKEKAVTEITESPKMMLLIQNNENLKLQVEQEKEQTKFWKDLYNEVKKDKENKENQINKLNREIGDIKIDCDRKIRDEQDIKVSAISQIQFETDKKIEEYKNTINTLNFRKRLKFLFKRKFDIE